MSVVAACGGEGTVRITPPEPRGPVAAACARLVNYLPATLVGKSARVVAPRSPLVHAWGSPPIVMRCGVAEPAGFDPASPRTAIVDGVTWFQVEGSDSVTWTAIAPAADVELIVPKSYEGQGAFLAELAQPIKTTLN